MLTVVPVLAGLLGSSVLAVQSGFIRLVNMLPLWIFYAQIIPLYVMAYSVAARIEKNYFKEPAMKPKAGSKFFLLFILPSMLLFSCGDWVVPKTLVGTWSATQKVTVRFKEGMFSYRFAASPVPVNIVMTIHEDGTVAGSVGEAKWEGCSVRKNRGGLSKKLNLFTDYVISGKLNGSIFAQDTLAGKEIQMPFNMKDNIIDGAIFQKQGMDIFPWWTFT